MKVRSKYFGERLRGVLRERGITVKEFAKTVGLSAVRVHTMIQGSEKHEYVYDSTVIKVSRALDLPFSFFVEDEQ